VSFRTGTRNTSRVVFVFCASVLEGKDKTPGKDKNIYAESVECRRTFMSLFSRTLGGRLCPAWTGRSVTCPRSPVAWPCQESEEMILAQDSGSGRGFTALDTSELLSWLGGWLSLPRPRLDEGEI
jgi:hypothetical protein